jgi:beta-1,4-mannooligosaccharide/beta-1,4-mannosyl-N-acetylglucosamine phosphorylase
MREVQLIGSNIPNMPWQDRPEGNENPVWRHNDNPVIKRNPAKGVARIFNSAVIAYEGSFPRRIPGRG